MENSPSGKGLRSIADILQQTLFPAETQAVAETDEKPSHEGAVSPTGRYDFDLAEFPFFHFDKNPDRPLKEPITYTDTIAGKDGQTISREWKVYPSAAYGFGAVLFTIET